MKLEHDPYNAFPLRTIETPTEVTRVEGCDCGGGPWHLQTCTIFDLPPEQRVANLDDAERRIKAYTDDLNEQVRCAYGKAAQ